MAQLTGSLNDRGELLGLLLDFDGTVAETERLGHRVAYNQAFAQLGLHWTWDEALYAQLLSVAGGKERLRYYLDRYRPELGDGDDAAKHRLIAEVYEAKIRNFASMAPHVPLRPGVRRLVHEARSAGAKVAIATTASRTGVEALLAQDDSVRGAIDLIAASEDVERKKPAPDVYRWAMDRLGLGAGGCVAVEDSNVGLRAALAAGLTTLVTVSDFTAGEDFTGAAAVLSDLGERDAPARTLRGPAPPAGIVDLAYLNGLRLRSST
jgi:HAD superfamily hydrolase (TIGR01509 family)